MLIQLDEKQRVNKNSFLQLNSQRNTGNAYKTDFDVSAPGFDTARIVVWDLGDR